jgi:hypothetical protein
MNFIFASVRWEKFLSLMQVNIVTLSSNLNVIILYTHSFRLHNKKHSFTVLKYASIWLIRHAFMLDACEDGVHCFGYGLSYPALLML